MTLLALGVMALAAALTVPPLLMFYLLKLRRRPLRVTSTMFWEQAAHDLQVNVPFKWLTPNWLLLLHALILALLLIAVGRPAVERGGTSAEQVFVLIDRTASMSAADMPDGSSRLTAAKAEAKATIDKLSRGAQPPEFTLIAWAAEPIVLAPPTRDQRRLGSLIDAIEPTDQPGDLPGALGLVRSLTDGARTDDDTQPPLTVLVTDGADLRSGRIALGASTRLVLVKPALATPPNAGLVSFAADRDAETPETVRVFVRLLNAGAQEVAAPLVVSLDSEPIVRRAVTIPPASDQPGESVETVEFNRDAGGVLEVSLERPDALDADNAVWAVLPPHRRPPTLLVVPPARTPDAPAAARDRADPFLLDVLDAIGAAALRVIDLDRYRRADADTLAEYGLIVFDRAAPDQPPPQPTLSFGVPWPGLPAPANPDRPGRTSVMSWDRGHPVMRDVVLDSIIVAQRIALPEDDVGSDATGPRRRRRTLARGEDGPLIVAIDDAGTRRIVVGFALEQSNWPVNFSFPIFMLSAFDYLSPGSASAIWHDTGTPTTVHLDRPARTFALSGPAPRTITRPDTDTSTTLPLGVLARVGLYTLTPSGGGDAPSVAVNLLDAGESSLAWMTPENGRATGRSGAGTPGETVEIWWDFVLAAGILLFLEWLVYARRARF